MSEIWQKIFKKGDFQDLFTKKFSHNKHNELFDWLDFSRYNFSELKENE